MSQSLEMRFETYCATMVGALMHADRAPPARWYIKGLLLPGERKSVAPMAARWPPHAVRSTHQSMHHWVADAPWSDEALMAAVAEQVVAKLVSQEAPVWWVVDDTGLPKKGTLGRGGAPVLRSDRQAG